MSIDGSSFGNRPYAGTYQMGSQTVVRHTPDCIVLINGHTEFASCATCNNKLDFNKYITQVSCDPTTEPVSTASVSLSIPTNDASVFSHDGNYVLVPGLEVLILIRGYFPVKGYAAKGQDSSAAGEASPASAADEKIPVYPYYQTFRGVVTEVSHEYSGGFYTAQISASNILHFWQYLQINTNGSVFGAAPELTGGGIDLTGHKMNGMSPYAIIYTLMRVGFGSAFGVGWTVAQKANIAAVSDGTGKSLYKHAALWWEKRWGEASTRLRMYGADGTIFNAFEQAFIGMFDVKGNAAKGAKFIKSFGIKLPRSFNPKAKAAYQAAARTVGYRASQFEEATVTATGTKQNVLKMQAFVLDLGRMGQPNMFDAEYMSKMEIADTVKGITGFEFYQDVDGDIVFKPPFYNLDTSVDPVYCIEDRDLVSISESHSEPTSTYVKGSGGLFQNFKGILDGEFGTRQGKFIDWRLVAEFGWKEANFESEYMSSSGQMFVSAMMRLDLNNVEMKSASITIPIRPELRPGYPVYVRCQDAFFYIKSMNHSFAVGGSCQTTINGVAKRAKFLPPGMPDRSDGDGSQPLPTLADVRLSAPGEYPPMPLYAYSEDLLNAESGEPSGPPRIMGYPNCVMALDPEKLNPRTFPAGIPLGSGQSFLDFALTLGVLRRDPENDQQYFLAQSNEKEQDKVITYNEVVDGFAEGGAADIINNAVSNDWLTNKKAVDELVTSANLSRGDRTVSKNFGAALLGVMQRTLSDIPDAGLMGNWISLQTASKNLYGHQSIQGQYRYFSSSAPDETDQAPSEVTLNGDNGTIEVATPGAPDTEHTITILSQSGSRIKVGEGLPTRAFRVFGTTASDSDDDDDRYADVTTNDIRFVTFQRIVTKRRVPIQSQSPTPFTAWQILTSGLKTAMADGMSAYASGLGSDEACGVRFGDSTEGEAPKSGGYGDYLNLIEAWANTAQVQTDRKYAAKFDQLKSDFAYALRSKQRNRLLKDSTLKADKVWRQADPKAIATLSSHAASDLAKLYQLAESAASKVEKAARKANAGAVDKAVISRLTVAQTNLLAGFPTVVINPSSGGNQIVTEELVESADHSLVLPVSDNEGYEVYGSLAYGRGLDIIAYKGLTELEGTPTDTNSMAAIEQFIAELIAAGGGKGAAVVKAFNALSDTHKANLAAGMDVTLNELEGAVEQLISEADSEQVFIRNTPVSSRSRGQSYTSNMSVDELAAITTEDGGICLCNGVEAQYYMQAFTGEFVELHGDEAMSEWLKEDAVDAGEAWTLTKQALAGEHLDTRAGSTLDRYKAIGTAFTEGYTTDLERIVQGGTQQVTNAVRDLEDLEIPHPDHRRSETYHIQILDDDGKIPGLPDSFYYPEEDNEEDNEEVRVAVKAATPIIGAGPGSPFNELYTQTGSGGRATGQDPDTGPTKKEGE
jgi:hypothetical protein